MPINQKSDNQCNVCGKMFPTRKLLGGHIKIHGNIVEKKIKNCEKSENTECLICHRLFNSRSIKSHVVQCDTGSLLCEYCDKRFSTLTGLYRHKKEVHMENLGEQRYDCDQCNYSAKRKSLLQHHMKEVHDKEHQVMIVLKTVDTSRPIWILSKGMK